MGKHSLVICEVCKTSMRSDHLKRHMEGNRCRQIVDRVSACPYLECDVYTDRTNLRKHLNNHHPESKNVKLKEIRSLSKGKSTIIGECESSEIKFGNTQLELFEGHEHTNVSKVLEKRAIKNIELTAEKLKKEEFSKAIKERNEWLRTAERLKKEYFQKATKKETNGLGKITKGKRQSVDKKLK